MPLRADNHLAGRPWRHLSDSNLSIDIRIAELALSASGLKKSGLETGLTLRFAQLVAEKNKRSEDTFRAATRVTLETGIAIS